MRTAPTGGARRRVAARGPTTPLQTITVAKTEIRASAVPPTGPRSIIDTISATSMMVRSERQGQRVPKGSPTQKGDDFRVEYQTMTAPTRPVPTGKEAVSVLKRCWVRVRWSARAREGSAMLHRGSLNVRHGERRQAGTQLWRVGKRRVNRPSVPGPLARWSPEVSAGAPADGEPGVAGGPD